MLKPVTEKISLSTGIQPIKESTNLLFLQLNIGLRDPHTCGPSMHRVSDWGGFLRMAPLRGAGSANPFEFFERFMAILCPFLFGVGGVVRFVVFFAQREDIGVLDVTLQCK